MEQNKYAWKVLFPLGRSGQGVKLTTHIHLVQSQECVDLHLHSPSTPLWRGA
jgi:hypothetical protein